jgi:hypothetical protein
MRKQLTSSSKDVTAFKKALELYISNRFLSIALAAVVVRTPESCLCTHCAHHWQNGRIYSKNYLHWKGLYIDGHFHTIAKAQGLQVTPMLHKGLKLSTMKAVGNLYILAKKLTFLSSEVSLSARVHWSTSFSWDDLSKKLELSVDLWSLPDTLHRSRIKRKPEQCCSW